MDDEERTRAGRLFICLAMFFCERKKKKKKNCSPGNSKVAKPDDSEWTEREFEERYRILPNNSERYDYERLIFVPQKQTVDCCSVLNTDGTVSVYRTTDSDGVTECSPSSVTSPLLKSSQSSYDDSQTTRAPAFGSLIEWGKSCCSNCGNTPAEEHPRTPKQSRISSSSTSSETECDGEENAGFRSSLLDKAVLCEHCSAKESEKCKILQNFSSDVKRTKLGVERCTVWRNDPCSSVSTSSSETSRKHNNVSSSPVRIAKNAEEAELPRTIQQSTTISSSNTITTNNRLTEPHSSNFTAGDDNHQSSPSTPAIPTPFTDNLTQLQNCGFYFKSLTSDGAREMLQHQTSGTFLLRDSSSQTSYFTLSFVNDKCEVKHLRIEYSCGRFRFHGTGSSTVGAKKKTAVTVLDLLSLYCNGETGTTLLRRPYTTVAY